MRSSDAAFDLTVREEVDNEAAYNAKYRRPTWPGASSGATVAIGYDLGQTGRDTIRADWSGRVPADMLDAMLAVSGYTGSNGKVAAQLIRNSVDIPWETALAVHRECVIPRWEATVARALPNTGELHPDCFGALVSLTFNRGASYSNTSDPDWLDRYREMRAIKAHMAEREFERIPAEFRRMKRLWEGKGLGGLLRRRDAEADLFERGLAAMRVHALPVTPSPQIVPAAPAGEPPWLARMTAILGLYEFDGAADNPLIIEMARICGGSIARDYIHDSIAWCALAANYCLVASGFPGNDSLWALDFQKYGVKLAGPAVGAIATKKRFNSRGQQIGGHVFFVVGKTTAGAIVGRGGNQSDMVCDELFDPGTITGYSWPDGYPRPAAVGLAQLPIAAPEPKLKRKIAALPLHSAPHSAPPLVPAQAPPAPDQRTSAAAAADEKASRGDPAVWRLQGALGFTGDDRDGEFGPRTEAALRRLQAAHWIAVTGKTDDDDTWDAIERIETEKQISPNIRGDPLTFRAQRILGFSGADLDGDDGPKTRAAVKRFQIEMGLPADGCAGPRTHDALDRRDGRNPEEPAQPAYTAAPGGLLSWIGRLFGRKG